MVLLRPGQVKAADVALGRLDRKLKAAGVVLLRVGQVKAADGDFGKLDRKVNAYVVYWGKVAPRVWTDFSNLRLKSRSCDMCLFCEQTSMPRAIRGVTIRAC